MIVISSIDRLNEKTFHYKFQKYTNAAINFNKNFAIINNLLNEKTMQKGRSSSDDKRRRALREIDNAAAGLSSAQLVEGAGDRIPRVIWRTAGSTVEDVASRTMRSPLFWTICYQTVSRYNL